VVSKDIILYIIAQISASGATGYFVEYAGSAIRALSMEARMTICNMSIEMGARGGMIAPDQTTFDYIKGRLFAPKGADWDKKLAAWKELYTDADAKFDVEINIKAEDIDPMITYGTNPGMGLSVRGTLPTIESFTDATEKQNYEKALAYMGLQAGQTLLGMPVQNVFIGSCTNSRIEDFRLVASIIKGKQKDPNIKTLIVPGSQEVNSTLDRLYNRGYKKGTVIGYVGSTGWSTGCHVHMEYWHGYPWRCGSYRLTPWPLINHGYWYFKRY
jgi:3-isopropylmalate/(R)-2-methylmalate dehydratase large subunit